MRTINKLIIHCADTPESMDIGVKEIREWHLERGWSDVGYHYVIRRDGTVELGRVESVVGAHCYGHNKESIGICLVGRDEFNDEQFDSLYRLIKDMEYRYGDVEVAGHYRYSDKTCPNFNVEEWLGEK